MPVAAIPNRPFPTADVHSFIHSFQLASQPAIHSFIHFFIPFNQTTRPDQLSSASKGNISNCHNRPTDRHNYNNWTMTMKIHFDGLVVVVACVELWTKENQNKTAETKLEDNTVMNKKEHKDNQPNKWTSHTHTHIPPQEWIWETNCWP